MSSQSHLWLRMGALTLLAAVAIWPRARAGLSSAELARASHDATATHSVAARAETTAARLASGPRTTKLVVADADESRLTN